MDKVTADSLEGNDFQIRATQQSKYNFMAIFWQQYTSGKK